MLHNLPIGLSVFLSDRPSPYVQKLRDFHGSLGDSEQAMLESILDTARGELGGYGMYKRSGVTEETWDDLVGWLED